MDTRLVVGCGSIGHALLQATGGYPGEVLVLDEQQHRVRRLREDGIAATHVDEMTPETLLGEVTDVGTVIVADDDAPANVRIARAARMAYPNAMILAYAGPDPDETTLAELEWEADRVIDPATETSAFLMDRVGDDGLQLRQLRQAVCDVDEPLAIVTHDNPDPDAIASAVALQRIADVLDVESRVCYYGRVSHQENQAFINLLDLELHRLDSDADVSEYGGFALVDHSRPGVNDQLPSDTRVDIVIDHHPPRAPVDARFVDLRSNVGATSTLLVQYLTNFGIEIDETVATGLLFGIRVDTDDFSREVAVEDFHAAATIVSHADIGTLEKIESPSISGDTFETIASAISNRQRRGSILTSHVEDLSDREALAQAADRLLDLEAVNATVVYGIKGGVIYISGRTRGTDLDLGETLRDAFDQIGSAGGHADMAGAQIQVAETTLATDAETTPEGPSDSSDPASSGARSAAEPTTEEADAMGTDGSDEITADLETFVAERFFEALASRPRRETLGLYDPTGAGQDATW